MFSRTQVAVCLGFLVLVLIGGFYVCYESEIARRLRVTQTALENGSFVHGEAEYDNACARKIVSKKTVESIVFPEIACCVIAPRDGGRPSFLHLVYVCDHGADGILIQVDGREDYYRSPTDGEVIRSDGDTRPIGIQYPTTDWLQPERLESNGFSAKDSRTVPVIYGTNEVMEKDYSEYCQMDSAVPMRVALAKDGRPISDYVPLEPAVHRSYPGLPDCGVQRIYPRPGDAFVMYTPTGLLDDNDAPTEEPMVENSPTEDIITENIGAETPAPEELLEESPEPIP